MARINCKSCGYSNEVVDDASLVICEACGTEQTIPKLDNEKKTLLYNRANAARLKCDFEKALANYELLLIDYPNEAEAHWGICLCRYGIEYVDDPKTKKKIPTCHRTIYNSIFDDIDYKEAINNSDVISRKKYQEEAEIINRIQKNALAISQKEKPYDIFICYKESDNYGRRTRDSFVAEDIYEELINKDYKVFYSRITLESKLGHQYEPIIFAALQSARVMLVIGSKKEYFEAVWVKNEWSRFLSFMANDPTNKFMIPCYRDMEAYDMPDEFLSLQSQNLDKLGAKQDLLRFIDKVFNKDRVVSVKQNTQTTYSNEISNLLKRVAILLEDSDYVKADSILESVLNKNPECAEAYAYKILIDKQLKKLSDIENLNTQLNDDKNYQRAIRFANDSFKEELEGYNNNILIRKKERESEKIYSEAIQKFELAKKESKIEMFIQAKNQFDSIYGFKDAQILSIECNEMINNIKYNEAMKVFCNAKTNNEAILFEQCIELFKELNGYKDSILKIEESKILILQSKYDQALINIKDKEYSNAISLLESIKEYKDSLELIKKCEKLIYDEMVSKIVLLSEKSLNMNPVKFKETVNIFNEKYNTVADKEISEKYTAIFEENYKQIKAEESTLKNIKRNKMKKIFLGSLTIVAVMAIVIIVICVLNSNSKYKKGIDYLENGNYLMAIENLSKSNNKNSDNLIQLSQCINDSKNRTFEYAHSSLKQFMIICSQLGYKATIYYDPLDGNCSINSELFSDQSFNQIATSDDSVFCDWYIDEFDINCDEKIIIISVSAIYESIFYYESYDFGIQITGVKSDNLKEDLVIPSEILGKKVLSIGKNAFEECSILESVILPNGLLNIDDKAFKDCKNLKEINIPYGVTNIGSYTFSGCTSLKTINLPDTVTTIGTFVFLSCKSLENITLSENITIIPKCAFSYCEKLGSIVIPGKVVSIHSNAFYNCISLTTIKLPASLKSTLNYSFYLCNNLLYVYFDGTYSKWSTITFGSYMGSPLSYGANLYVKDSNGNYVVH